MTRKSKKKQIGKPSVRTKAHERVNLRELQNIQEAISRGDLLVANQLATEFTRLNANSSQGWEMLANIQEQQQDVIGACQSMQKALECAKEKNPLSVVKLAQYELLAGKANKAIERLKNISKDAPKEKNVWVVLSRAYHLLGLNKEALEANDVAFALDADYPAMLMLRTRILDQLKRHREAYSTAKKVKKIVPNQYGISNYLATLSLREGDYEAAEKYFNEELELGENSEAAYNSFIAKHYNPTSTAEELTKIATDWQNRYLKDITAKRADTKVRKSKRIRIGLLSGGFRRHPVGQMILPALQNMDKNEAELFFYTTNQIVDHLTLDIKKTADSWASVTELSDEQLNERIRQDQVDILIDMNGGGEGSRFMALAKEPAPLIVKWVGILINTTGLKCFDYLLSDSIETPRGADHLYTEKLIRLPDDYICYQLPTYIPKVSSLPALKNQFITFGCLNNPAKLSDPLIQEWSKLLQEVPNSKFLLRGIQFEGSDFCQRTLSRFAECGIEAERLLLEGPDKHEEFLKTYQRIDIALDTWPYSGGLTTCEALAMGVPVVTCVGPTFAGRHSATHLANAGLPELVTDNWDDFRKRAKELAADLPSLAVIRAALRTILIESPVCDGERFAQHFTKAMRGIWQRYCEGKAPEALTFNKEGDAWFADEDQPIELVEVEAEPELQEAEFEWNLESPITVIDNGALFARHPKFPEWMQTGNFAVITFDPGSLLTKQADELKQLGEWHHYPHATLGDGKDATLYATLDPELTGTLQPVEEQQTGEQDDPLRVLSTLPISTVALDAIEGLSGVDLLVLDSLNDAMAILENGHTYLANTLLLQVKLAFQPTHERQPNLAELQRWASLNGLDFLRLENMTYKGLELKSADAIFVARDIDSQQKGKVEWLLANLYEKSDGESVTDIDTLAGDGVQAKEHHFKDGDELYFVKHQKEKRQKEENKKLLIVCSRGETFIKPIVEMFSKKFDVEYWHLDYRLPDMERLQSLMDWSDVTWFEWCDEVVVKASNAIQKNCKVVCRLHGFEAFSQWPDKIESGFLDRLIFVSEHTMEYVKNRGVNIPSVVIHNGVDLEGFTYKERGPGFSLAFVASFKNVKNPQLLVQIVEKLVKIDKRYTVHVAGKISDPVLYRYINHMLESLCIKENVVFYGHVENIDAWLEGKDYLISTSVSESFGYNIAEAMAKGIKPLIHNWPGAKNIYPQSLVFNTVEEAVSMITSETYDSKMYRELIVTKYSRLQQIENILPYVL